MSDYNLAGDYPDGCSGPPDERNTDAEVDALGMIDAELRYVAADEKHLRVTAGGDFEYDDEGRVWFTLPTIMVRVNCDADADVMACEVLSESSILLSVAQSMAGDRVHLARVAREARGAT